MRGMHARLPKNFVLEERLERYARAIETHPAALRGSWAEACRPLTEEGATSFREVHLDLGCGKGQYACGEAEAHPEILYVGMDIEPVALAYAAQLACESDLDNALFIAGNGRRVTEYFASGELARIHLNFPTPFPRKRDAEHRLVNLEHLMLYRQVLAEGGILEFKTDSQPLFDFAHTQLALAGYGILWETDDCRGERPDDPMTLYEARLSARGATVFALEATPAEDPGEPEQTAELSLSAYLPENLDEMEYVPYGMEGNVENLRNRRANLAARRERKRG